jgi:hypothetical protein
VQVSTVPGTVSTVMSQVMSESRTVVTVKGEIRVETQ